MRNLRSQWNSFYRFCQAFSLVPLPASPSTISSYAVFLTQRTSSYQYILGHLNAVRLLHLYHGLPVDSFTCFEVSLTKKGLKRVLGTATRQKHPITSAILLASPFPGHELTISHHDMGLVHGCLLFFSAQVKLGFADNVDL